MNGPYVNKQPMVYSNGHDTPYRTPYGAPTNLNELPASSSAPSMHMFERPSPVEETMLYVTLCTDTCVDSRRFVRSKYTEIHLTIAMHPID
jgi:hypothetical protein